MWQANIPILDIIVMAKRSLIDDFLKILWLQEMRSVLDGAVILICSNIKMSSISCRSEFGDLWEMLLSLSHWTVESKLITLVIS